MGGNLSRTSCPDEARSNGKRGGKVSAETKRKLTAFLEDDYYSRFNVSVPDLQKLLTLIPMNEDILQVYYENGFNLLQKCVAENNVEAVKLILEREPDLNSGPCSLPLHIACMKGYPECIQDLIKHGARLDVEAQMCWPGPHTRHCLGRKNESKQFRKGTSVFDRSLRKREDGIKCENAFYYALDKEQCYVLEYLMMIYESEFQGTIELGPLLEAASEKQAWSCCNVLLEHADEEIDSSTLRNLLARKPQDAEMTLFHVLFFMVRKSAEFTLRTCKSFLRNGLRSEINTVNSVGNTPLQSLIIRYGFEESRQRWLRDYEPWGQKETKEMITLLLENGATELLNEPGNNTFSLIIRHIDDWKFIYDILATIIENGVSPVVEDSDGNCPLMVCIIRLMSEVPLDKFDEKSKFFFLHCIRLLCMAGADPNCMFKWELKLLHMLVFIASESLASLTDEQMSENFEFIRQILVLLFEFGLDADSLTNVAPKVFNGIVKMVERSNWPIDLEKIYELVLTFIQYGVNPNSPMHFPALQTSLYDEGNPFPVRECTHLLGYMFFALAEKEELLHDREETFARILYLLYFSMDHDELYKCLNFLCVELPLVLPDGPCQILCDKVRDMLSQPRTLKQMARAVINRSMGGKPGLYADQLPLPKILQNYLMNYDP